MTEKLEQITDEIIALLVVTPIISVLCYLAYSGQANVELLLTPLGMVLSYYFAKKGSDERK